MLLCVNSRERRERTEDSGTVSPAITVIWVENPKFRIGAIQLKISLCVTPRSVGLLLLTYKDLRIFPDYSCVIELCSIPDGCSYSSLGISVNHMCVPTPRHLECTFSNAPVTSGVASHLVSIRFK